MQNEHNIEQRMPFYLSSNYVGSIKESEPYSNCKKAIVISILNFNYYKRNAYHMVARMKFEEEKPSEVVDMGYKEEEQDKYATKYLELHIIELPKFRKKKPEVHTKLEQWLWLFVGSEEEVQKASKLNKEIEKINKKLASMSLSNEERNNYEFRLKAIRDEADVKDYIAKKAREEGERLGEERGKKLGERLGEERGEIQGEKRTQEEIIKSMIEEKLSIQEIERFTKIPEAEIKRIIEESK